MATHNGHPVRLPDGSWGVKVEGNGVVEIGDTVDVTDRAGETWTITVSEVLDRDQWGTKVRRATHRKDTNSGNE